jgi:NADPH:quinone reductase-like Zn-dependent oxidoreductase
MKAVRFHEYGDASVLRYEDAPEPVIGPGEALVRVRAAAVNHVDIDMRDGSSRLPISLPHTLGFEVAGDVAELGGEASGVTVGQRVAPQYQIHCRQCPRCLEGEHSLCQRTQMLGVQLPGGYAEYVKVPAWTLLPIPDDVSYTDAAAVQTTLGTAWHALIRRASLRAGETVLVSAAGSGVGTAGIQVARRAGARVIASAGSAEKLERAAQLGAAAGVNYREQDLTAEVLELTQGAGVDVVLEHVGGKVFEASLKTLRPNGRMVVVGGHGGEVVPLDLIVLFRNQWSVIGCQRQTEAELRQVFDLVSSRDLRPTIHTVLPLGEAAEAHRILEHREQFGKVILTP